MSARSQHAGSTESKLRRLHDAFVRHFGEEKDEVLLGGRETTYPEIRERRATALKVFEAVHYAEAVLYQALRERRRALPGIRSTYADVVALIKYRLGRGDERLTDFGIRPYKPRAPLTAEAQFVAQARAAETRRRRDTSKSIA